MGEMRTKASVNDDVYCKVYLECGSDVVDKVGIGQHRRVRRSCEAGVDILRKQKQGRGMSFQLKTSEIYSNGNFVRGWECID